MSRIPERTLGRTELVVSQLGFGAMELRGERIWGGRPCNTSEARTILNAALDEGINFIDTANDYGTSELYIGRYLAERRDKFYLATKCGCNMQFAGDHDETPHIWTRENIMHNIADSLMKLNTSYVDILQLHNPDVESCKRNELVGVLHELKNAGVTRYIGCSTTTPHFEEYIKWNVFDVFQVPYSALQRTHENLITKAAQNGAGIIIRGGVGMGEPGKARGKQEAWALFEKARLDELRDPNESRIDFLLRFTITHPHCDTTIVGTKDHNHLLENIATVREGPLSPEIYEEAKKRLSDAGETPLEVD